MATTQIGQILLRGGTSAEWATYNPVLAAREVAIDTTLNRAKLGDGKTSWSGLPWITMSSAEVARLESTAAALEGATAPTDAAMASVQADPASAFAKAQKATKLVVRCGTGHLRRHDVENLYTGATYTPRHDRRARSSRVWACLSSRSVPFTEPSPHE
ncbi:hypothetical protein [Microbacterium enclense]|uniref:hyaluronate lyase N-terminal domain-containing protein n=1 Tax=Microbacterium enclense TaxID=993073 RepID=UPI00342B8BC1